MGGKEKKYTPEHINYALVEDTRPAMYRAMKYWGRKPHNIWADFISHYCPEGGIVLDPFVGSGISAFESAIIGKKVIATDLNPLTAFIIRTIGSNSFNSDEFIVAANAVISAIEKDPIYQRHYVKNGMTVYNYVWAFNALSSVRCKDINGVQYVQKPDANDIEIASEMSSIQIPHWFPTDKLPLNHSISIKFINDIGGNSFQYLWTRRNLYILAKLFNEISKQPSNVQDFLMLAFIHSLHLTSKMVVPRSEKGNRDFSGSWGRADYMIRNRSMEQNPLICFHRSCFDEGVLSAMQNSIERLGSNRTTIHRIDLTGKISQKTLVNYGVVDVADLEDYLKPESIDFIITDPPYGGLVQYMDLSMVWLVWLQKYDPTLKPDNTGEITYKKGYVPREEYSKKLIGAFKKLHILLKEGHYMIVTFHNQDMNEWNEFVSAIRRAGFVIEKVTHQYNKRSGESNVSNPYGTSGSDLYIRCLKTKHINHSDERIDLQQYIVEQTISILASRNEPTEFEFISSTLLAEMLQAGYLKPDEPAGELKNLLAKEVGVDKIFSITKNDTGKTGDYYWFNDPSKYISHGNIPLSLRVDECIKSLLKRKISVKYDEVVAEVFKTFPDGLTPDPRGLKRVLKQYAKESNGKWKYTPISESNSSEHSAKIYNLCRHGKKSHCQVFVGRREQPEIMNGKPLAIQSNFNTLKDVLKDYDAYKLSRIEMIDCVWIRNNSIEAVFEVENSTDFLNAVSRSSNISPDIPKFMLIPDIREKELLNMKDPLFIKMFKEGNWRYLTYTDFSYINGKSGVAAFNLVSKVL